MRALEFITGHVIFKLRYNQIYQLKTTLVVVLKNERNLNGLSFSFKHMLNDNYELYI